MTRTALQRQQHALRSFVRREGRMTPAQQRALAQLWSRYGVQNVPEPTTPAQPNSTLPTLDFDRLFNRCGHLRVLDIGFGNGEALALLAQRYPSMDYLGVEVHRPGIGQLLQRLATLELDNVRIAYADAVQLLREQLPEASFDRINIFFPDPWPKKRHHKRRLIQPELVSLLAHCMKPEALLHLATDWQPYAEHMRLTLDAAGEFCASRDTAIEPRPETKFERRGKSKGHAVWDLIYLRC